MAVAHKKCNSDIDDNWMRNLLLNQDKRRNSADAIAATSTKTQNWFELIVLWFPNLVWLYTKIKRCSLNVHHFLWANQLSVQCIGSTMAHNLVHDQNFLIAHLNKEHNRDDSMHFHPNPLTQLTMLMFTIVTSITR